MIHPVHALAATLAVCLGGGVACAQSAPEPAGATTIASGAAPESIQMVTDNAVNGPSRSMAGAGAQVPPNTVTVMSSPPIPDTLANRAKYGQPLSNGGRRTPAAGN